MQRFKVIIPETKDKSAELPRIKRMICTQKPVLGKILLSLTFVEPGRVAELHKSLISNFKQVISKPTLYTHLEILESMGLIESKLGWKAEQENTDPLTKEIKVKFRTFMLKHKNPLKKETIKFYYISDFGASLLDFCCEKFGYKLQKEVK